MSNKMLDKERLVTALTTLQDDTVLFALNSEPFLAACEEMTELTQLLGPALYFAGEHLKTKLAQTHELVAAWTSRNEPFNVALGPSLYALMKLDSGEVYNVSVNQQGIKYCVLRLMWLLDFAEGVLTNLISDKFKDESLQACVSAAYKDRLEDKHKWFVRRAVMLGLYACPSRDAFLTALNPHDSARAMEEIKQYRTLLQKVVGGVYGIIEKLHLQVKV